MTEPKTIPCLKGNMLLALAGLKTRFIGDATHPVMKNSLYFLSSDFKQADGTMLTHRIPIIVTGIDADKSRASLSADELKQAGYSSLNDLIQRVTQTQDYANYIMERHGAGPNGTHFEHPLDADSLQKYDAQNFTFRLPTMLELRRHGYGVDALGEMRKTINAIVQEDGRNSMIGAAQFAQTEYGKSVADLSHDARLAIGEIQAGRRAHESSARGAA